MSVAELGPVARAEKAEAEVERLRTELDVCRDCLAGVAYAAHQAALKGCSEERGSTTSDLEAALR